MTYQEVQDRLTRVQSALTSLQDGTYNNIQSINVPQTVSQLQEMEESLKAQLSLLAEEGMVATDDEAQAEKLAKKGVNVKLTKEMKPGSEEAMEHERFKRLSSKDQEAIQKIRALMQAEKDEVSEDDKYDREDGDGHLGTNTDADLDREQLAQLSTRNEAEEEETVEVPVDSEPAPQPDGGEDDHDVGHQDDEPDMLKQYAYDIAHYAAKLYKQLDKYDRMDGEVDFPNWWQSKLILAKDYISKAQHYLEFEEKQPAIDQLALEEGVNERSAGAVKKEYDSLIASMKDLAKKYKEAEGKEKEEIKDKLLANTKRKRALEKELDDAVSGTNRGQELDVQEGYRGVMDDVVEIIKDMAMNADGDEIEAAMELMEFIGEHYKIDFEFGRAGGGNYGRNDGAPYEEGVNEAKATCCGRCGRVHVKSGKCTRSKATGSDRCDK